jgi:TorA maturation chaperone TorD
MTVEAAARVQVHRPLAPEEQARADFYALLARLCHAAPDAKLLGAISIAGEIPPEGEPALTTAWSGFVAAASVMDPEAVAEEYHTLFEGMGAAEVSIYSAFYSGAMSADHPRVKIRSDLSDLGLAQRERLTEPEDHFAGLFEAMRVLIAGGAGRSPGTIAEQRQFFQSHLEPGVAKFFKAVEAAGSANFYRKVGALGLAFMQIESESFRLG